MAAELKFFKTRFVFCADKAMKDHLTAKEVGEGMYGYLNVEAFVGHWRQPTHLLVNADGKPWLIAIEEVREEEGGLEELEATRTSILLVQTVFVYCGSNREFLLAVKAEDAKLNQSK